MALTHVVCYGLGHQARKVFVAAWAGGAAEEEISTQHFALDALEYAAMVSQSLASYIEVFCAVVWGPSGEVGSQVCEAFCDLEHPRLGFVGGVDAAEH